MQLSQKEKVEEEIQKRVTKSSKTKNVFKKQDVGSSSEGVTQESTPFVSFSKFEKEPEDVEEVKTPIKTATVKEVKPNKQANKKRKLKDISNSQDEVKP